MLEHHPAKGEGGEHMSSVLGIGLKVALQMVVLGGTTEQPQSEGRQGADEQQDLEALFAAGLV